MRAPIVLAAVLVSITLGVSACGSSHRATSAIGVALRSDGLYSIFPGRVATEPCRISHGGAAPGGGSFAGTCSTRTVDLSASQTEVVFTESWEQTSHTWSVEVSRLGKVLATRSRGALPPQDYQ
jgi:hypothetical protein